MSNTHKLAVFISHIYGDFQSSLCQGIVGKAKEYGYLIDFYVSNDEKVIGAYGSGEKDLFNVPNLNAYEGILISSDTYLVPEVQKALFAKLEEASCPIVDINNLNSPYPAVSLDNISMMDTLVSHLYSCHNIKKFAYLGSALHPHISNLRLDSFVRGLETYNMKSEDALYFDSDFSYESIGKAVDMFLNHEQVPEGIICYNDELAFMLVEELSRRGVSVPQEMAVTGCDNLRYGERITPSLTTISFPADELGVLAFDTLLALIDGQKTPEMNHVKAQPIIKGSCGCSYKQAAPQIIFSNNMNYKIMHLESKILEGIHMSGSLQSYDTLEQVTSYLEESLHNYPEISDFYFFLYSNWHEMDTNLLALLESDSSYCWDGIDLKLGVSRGQRLPDHTFMNKQAVAEFLEQHTENLRLFVPLYFGNKSFGFLCFTYPSDDIYYPFTFVTWLQNLNMVLKNLSDQHNMQLIKEHLQDLNYKDDITGLYNRHGFQFYSFQSLKNYELGNTTGMLVNFEINEFQNLNTNFGLEESNFALVIFAKAIAKNFNTDCVCSRYRGSNFQILAPFKGDILCTQIFQNIQSYLKNYQELYGKDYKISFSCNYITLTGYNEDSLYEGLMHIHEKERVFYV